MQRQLLCTLLLSVSACQLPSEQPPATPEKASSDSSTEPAPLPPEETPPPESEPTPPPEAKPVEPGITSTSGAPKRGSLPKAVIDEKLKSVQPGVLACYERGLKTKPELRGSVSINFVVADDGKIAHAEAIDTEDPFSDAATVDCILGEIRKLVFPAPSGGRVFLNYPVKLEPPPAPAPAGPPAKK